MILWKTLCFKEITTDVRNDRSGADWYVARKLWWWRFHPTADCRNHAVLPVVCETAREDYMEHTVAKACEGPQYKSPENSCARLHPSLPMQKNTTLKRSQRIFLRITRLFTCASPRGGKSYWGLTIIAKRGEGIYVAPNHEIIEQQFNTFTRKIARTTRCARG